MIVFCCDMAASIARSNWIVLLEAAGKKNCISFLLLALEKKLLAADFLSSVRVSGAGWRR
jgi:hypothetical protein